MKTIKPKFRLLLNLLIIFGVISHIFSTGFASEISNLSSNAFNAYEQGNYDLSIENFNELIQLNSSNAYYYLGRGAAYLGKNDYKKAIADFDTTLHYRTIASAYNSRGHAYSRLGDREKMMADYNKAIELKPNNPDFYMDRATAYFFENQFETAKIDFSTAILLFPDKPDKTSKLADAYNSRGWLYYIKGNKQCFDDFNRAIELRPKSEMYVNRANAFMWVKDYPSALADYNMAIKLSATNATAYARRSECFSIKGDFVKGIADCVESIRLDPNNWLAYNNLATFLAVCPDPKIRNGQQALQNALKAGELTAWKEPKTFDILAAAYAATGDFTNAVKWQEKSMESMPPSPAAQKRLILYKQNKPYYLPAPK